MLTRRSPIRRSPPRKQQRLKEKIITVKIYFAFNIPHKLVTQLKTPNKFFTTVHSQESVEASFIPRREEIAQQLHHSKQVSL
jgi:hypothetical protein